MSVSLDSLTVLSQVSAEFDLHTLAFSTDPEPVPEFSCVGFEKPMNNGPVMGQKKRVLPFKAQLTDNDGNIIIDADIISPPVIQVLKGDTGRSNPPIDVTSEELPAGHGTEGNQFVFTSDGKWRFNLKTKNYSAPGTYTISILTGNSTEYVINPPCTATFVIKRMRKWQYRR